MYSTYYIKTSQMTIYTTVKRKCIVQTICIKSDFYQVLHTQYMAAALHVE